MSDSGDAGPIPPTRSTDYEAMAGQLFMDFLRRTHLSAPDDIPHIVAEVASRFGAEEVRIYLTDYEQRHLIPLAAQPSADATTTARTLRIDGTLPGRCFATTKIVAGHRTRGRQQVFAPLLDGTERLGAIAYTLRLPEADLPEPVVEIVERYSHLVAQTIMTKRFYGDVVERARRTRPMSLSTELLRALLPPLVFATEGLVITGIAEPTYDAGGDIFDYAVNGTVAHLGIFDAMGHGLAAARDASFAVTAYRSARRRGLGLEAMYQELDAAIETQPGERFVTAILAELDLAGGTLRWLNAGHPPPLLVRDTKLVKSLENEPALPLGLRLPHTDPVIGKEKLQPGDQVLLYTDGLTEARLEDGTFLTEARLGEFVEREAAGRYAATETLRRIRHAIIDHQQGRLQDDATALLVEWAGPGPHRIVPQTV